MSRPVGVIGGAARPLQIAVFEGHKRGNPATTRSCSALPSCIRKTGTDGHATVRGPRCAVGIKPARRHERQAGRCPKCGKHFKIEEMEADHATPWSQGGKTNAANCQMLCLEDNRRKGAI